jgi:hypothetical protein
MAAGELFVIGVTRKVQHWHGFAGIPSGSPCGPDGISAFARYLPDVQSNRLIDNKTARAVVRQAGGRNAYRRL